MTNNQQQSKQPIYCQWCHNVEITFSEHFKSKTGKFIPIEKASGVPHNCPQNPNRQQQQQSQQQTQQNPDTKSPKQQFEAPVFEPREPPPQSIHDKYRIIE